MTHRTDPSQTSRENRTRDPRKVKGVRLRLRTALRASGVTGKLATDFRRRPELHLAVWVETAEMCSIVKAECKDGFEGYQVRVYSINA